MFLTVKDLKKSYGSGSTKVEVLKGINFEVQKGEICVLLGPSGSGKSTLLNIIGGIDDADSGYVSINDEKTKDMKESELTKYRRKHLGYVFQMYNLIPNLNVKENITLPCELDGREPDKAELAELINTLGLDERINHLPNQLSGGQQQRLCIARTLAVEPEVILMDEPTSALDPISTSRIEDLAIELKNQYTIVMVTHNMQQAVRVSDDTAFFLVGEMVEFGDTKTIFSYPKDKRTEDYITGRFG